MIRAYNEVYLSSVYRNLASLFDLAVYYGDMDLSDFLGMFRSSSVARGIENGSPKYLAGMSPQEMFREIALRESDDYVSPSESSDAAWCGSVLAYSQWYCGCTFRELTEAVPAERLLSLQRSFRDDPMSAATIIVDTLHPVAILKKLREDRGLSQSDLSLISGVPIRSIRAYEQGSVDLCKAQGDTLFHLAKALGCTVDALIRG